MNIQGIIQDIKNMVSAFGLMDIFKIWSIINKAVNTVKKIKGFVEDNELTEPEVSQAVALLKELFMESGIPFTNGVQLGWIIRGSWAIYQIVKK